MMDISEIRHSNVRLLVRHLDEADGKQGSRAGGLTKLAAKLGKASGQVAHFASENPIKKIGDQIAREIEVAFGLEHGWMDWLQDRPETAQLSRSQSVRLDPLMIAETHQALREVYEEAGRVYRIEDEPARFVRVYELRASLSDKPSQDEWIQFGRKLAAVMVPQGAVEDGQRSGESAQGADQAGVARRVQAKA